MRLRDIIQEAASNVIYQGDDDLVVIENPSRNQFFGLMNRSKEKKLRGLLDSSLIVWDAYLAIHADVITLLEHELGEVYDGADLELQPKSIIMNSFWSDSPMESEAAHEDAVKIADWLRQELSAYYGPDTPVTVVKDGSYESITI